MQKSWQKNLLRPLLLAGSFLAMSCGSSSSDNEATNLANTGGTCVNNPGATGSWEITSLDAATQWTRVCEEGGDLTTTSKFLRFENLKVAEGASLSLMPFSSGSDNGFLIRFSHDKMETGFSPLLSTQETESFAVDLTEAKTFCVEIHGQTSETHIWGYLKGTEEAGCVTRDRTEPAANWDVDSPASDKIGGLQLGYSVAGTVEFDKIVLTNRASNAEAGNPSE